MLRDGQDIPDVTLVCGDEDGWRDKKILPQGGKDFGVVFGGRSREERGNKTREFQRNSKLDQVHRIIYSSWLVFYKGGQLYG